MEKDGEKMTVDGSLDGKPVMDRETWSGAKMERILRFFPFSVSVANRSKKASNEEMGGGKVRMKKKRAPGNERGRERCEIVKRDEKVK